jgi:Leucine-rich repeat (LRR) protein
MDTFNALKIFYDAMDGPNWRYPNDTTPWSFPSTLNEPCSVPWSGVECNQSVVDDVNGCEVVALSLVAYRLTGQLPQELYTMQSLTTLSFGVNRISGTLSSDISNLTSLVELSLFENKFTGLLPTSLGLLTQLWTVDLTINSFTGPIPTELGRLSLVYLMYLKYNLLDGTIPTEMGQLTSVLFLDLTSNLLTGPIPTELYGLSEVEYLYLSENPLTGSISTEIGHLTALSYLLAYTTHIGGIIPSEFCGMSNLIELLIYNNAFTGRIPAEIGMLTQLTYLSLYGNQLTGPIPLSVANLTSSLTIALMYNFLTGTIPDISAAMTLSKLYLYNNLLTGSIPSELSGSSGIDLIDISDNLITGSLPVPIGSYDSMTMLVLSDNFMTGTIDVLTNNTSILDLYLYANFFSGSIPVIATLGECLLYSNLFTGSLPSGIEDFSGMVEFDVHQNLLTGSVPANFFHTGAENLDLENVDLSVNCLTGTLPPSIWSFKRLRKFNISYNMFTGPFSKPAASWPLLRSISFNDNYMTSSLPVTFSLNRSVIESIAAEDNYLTGTMPSAIALCVNLLSLSVSDNYFTSSLPSELAYLSLLQFLNVSYNQLDGPVVALFTEREHGALTRLVTVDLSANAFTGLLPSALFTNSPNLSDVIMFSNCFSGSLPSTLCDAQSLKVLVMDSVTSAPTCDKNFPPLLAAIFKVVIGQRRLLGAIPGCVWDGMPLLNTLHLAGNGLVGTLGELAPRLADISLASNRLSGTLPISWQTSATLLSVDLSSNKLSGTLAADYVINASASVDLTVNRLSGFIPAAFRYASSINILDENLFQCDEGAMPEHDPASGNYVCGSSSFNTALITLAVTLFVVATASLGYRPVTEQLIHQVTAFHTLMQSASVDSRSLDPLMAVCKQVERAALFMTWLGTLMVVVGMCFYATLKVCPSFAGYYSTHTVQYTWVVSVVYLHGVVPFVFVTLFLTLAILGTFKSLYKSIDDPNIAEIPAIEMVVAVPPSFTLKAHTTFIICAHCAVIMTVNVLYVFAVLVGLPSGKLFLVQFFLSAFKVVWSNVCVSLSLKSLRLTIRQRSLLAIFMSLFTFLVSPLLATFFTNDSCFRYVITGLPPVSSAFYVQQFACSLDCHETECVDYCLITPTAETAAFSTVVPAWMYSYQCSSAVLINYVPVLLYSVILSGLLFPLVRVIVISHPRMWGAYLSLLERFRGTSVLGASSNVERSKLVVSVFGDAQLSLINRSYLNLGMLLTFGLASPLLVLGIVLDCWSNLVVLKLLVIKHVANHHIASSRETSSDGGATALAKMDVLLLTGNQCVIAGREPTNPDGGKLDSASALYSPPRASSSAPPEIFNASQPASASLGMVLAVTLCFWAIFGFDMIGDVYGQVTGLYCLLIMPFAVLLSLLAGVYCPDKHVLNTCLTTRDPMSNKEECLHDNRTVSVVEMNQRFTVDAP